MSTKKPPIIYDPATGRYRRGGRFVSLTTAQKSSTARASYAAHLAREREKAAKQKRDSERKQKELKKRRKKVAKKIAHKKRPQTIHKKKAKKRPISAIKKAPKTDTKKRVSKKASELKPKKKTAKKKTTTAAPKKKRIYDEAFIFEDSRVAGQYVVSNLGGYSVQRLARLILSHILEPHEMLRFRFFYKMAVRPDGTTDLTGHVDENGILHAKKGHEIGTGSTHPLDWSVVTKHKKYTEVVSFLRGNHPYHKIRGPVLWYWMSKRRRHKGDE